MCSKVFLFLQFERFSGCESWEIEVPFVECENQGNFWDLNDGAFLFLNVL
jgi:hypothetical protein